MLKELDREYITLTRKHNNPDGVGHSRLISLGNILYKIILKNRLKKVLPKIISPTKELSSRIEISMTIF